MRGKASGVGSVYSKSTLTASASNAAIASAITRYSVVGFSTAAIFESVDGVFKPKLRLKVGSKKLTLHAHQV